VKKRILALASILALVAVLAVPMAAFAATSTVTGNPTATIDITVPATKAITLVPGASASTAVDSVTVSCNTATWLVKAKDADATNTNGYMAPYATTAAGYQPSGVKLASVMSVIAASATGATGATVALPTEGTILTGSAVVSSQAYTLTFSQPVSYSDAILSGDGSATSLPNTYRIVVTFTASTS
jgi:hypothetical protein